METLVDYIEVISFITVCGIFLYTVRSHVLDIRESVKELNQTIAAIREHNSEEHRQFMREMNERHKELMVVISEQTKLLAVIHSSLDKHIIHDIHNKK